MNESLARDLEILAGLFKAGGWQELRVEFDGFRLLFSEDASAGLGEGRIGVSAPVATSPAAGVAVPSPQPSAQAAPAAVANGPADPAWIAVTAPNLGTFYRSPRPGSPPFVEIGQKITVDTEICLLEVMKLFTSVKAGIAGTLRQVCAGDAELVEGGQVLFYIECD